MATPASDTEELSTTVTRAIDCLDHAATSVHCEEVSHERSHLHRDALRDSLDRLRLWVGSLGALHHSTDARSLEHRLRKAPQVRARINEILAALFAKLCTVIDEPIQREKEQQEVSIPQQDLDVLDMLGLAGDDMSDASCMVSSICEDIADDISYLFKVSALISKSIARDRYARAEAASIEKFNDQYDVAHVKAKFQQGQAPQWLLIRLGQAITKRRQYIKYVREHRMRIEDVTAQRNKPELAIDANRKATFQHSDLPTAATVAPSNVSRPSQMLTIATTVVPHAFVNIEQGFEDNRSVTTANTTSFNEDPEQVLLVPSLTSYAKLGQEFPCPFCPTTNKFSSQTSWKRHVYADLRAYLCTHQECGMAMFDDKRAWIDHEMEKHWRCWYCHLCAFKSFTDRCLASHLEQHHAAVFDQDTRERVLSMSSRPLDYIDASRCMLCNWGQALLTTQSTTLVTRDAFMNHLAFHLRQLALFAIPREISCEDGTGSGSLQTADGVHLGSQILANATRVPTSAKAGVTQETASRSGNQSALTSAKTQEFVPRAGGIVASLAAISEAFPTAAENATDITSVWVAQTPDQSEDIELSEFEMLDHNKASDALSNSEQSLVFREARDAIESGSTGPTEAAGLYTDSIRQDPSAPTPHNNDYERYIPSKPYINDYGPPPAPTRETFPDVPFRRSPL